MDDTSDTDDFRCERCKDAQVRNLCSGCFSALGELLKEHDLYPFDDKRWKAFLGPHKNTANFARAFDSPEYVAFCFYMEEAERTKSPRPRIHWNLPEHMDEVWQRDAVTYVRKAVARGVLPDLRRGDIACVDCGAVATLWEHRSYSRPLDVEPTCRGCNVRRGTAHWPSAADYSFAKVKAAA